MTPHMHKRLQAAEGGSAISGGREINEPRRLADLTAGLVNVPSELVVRDVTLDSRAASPGALFLACSGRTHHGLEFAQQACRSARAQCCTRKQPAQAVPDFGSDIFVAAVPQLSQHVGTIADRFFGAPSAAVTVAGITGTNGKTTCAWLLAQALQHCGRPAAYMGTLGFGVPPAVTATEHTTSDAVTVQRHLAALRNLGAECVAWKSHRTRSIRTGWAPSASTPPRSPISPATTSTTTGRWKPTAPPRRACSQWPSLANRVINVDDAFGAKLAAQPSPSRLVSPHGRRSVPAGVEQVRAIRATPQSAGLAIDVESSWGNIQLTVPLIGEFNVDNVLTVLAVLLAWDIPLAQAAAALEKCRAPSGRMELFGGTATSPLAIVDYAHTPDALAKALQAARPALPWSTSCCVRLWW